MNESTPLLALLDLARRARAAGSGEELAFLAVNDSHALAAYRQAALWFAAGGVKALSGVVQLEANAPYVQWLNRVCRHLHERGGGPSPLGAPKNEGPPQVFLPPSGGGNGVAVSGGHSELPAEEAAEWAEWLPEFGLWLPFPAGPAEDGGGGLLLAADHPWSEEAIILLQEWLETWHHTWLARVQPPRWSWLQLSRQPGGWLAPRAGVPWWRQKRLRIAAAVLAALLFPVRLSVLAPGELVPANPAVIRAPLDGVLGQFHVRPNQAVKAGQPLFGFDEASIAARLEVAAQAQATAEAEYRQYAQQAVSDGKSKAQLAILLGKIEEKRAEADYLRGQLERSRVLAPQDGIALFDDPGEWIGKPVQTGERIMRIAAPGDVEVEAWIPLGDAIPLPADAPVSLYLAADPLASLSARLRYLAHDAVPRPDGTYAYRLRARLEGGGGRRVGLKGTAKVHGQWVPAVYWMLRRPLATIRQTLGL